MSLRMNMYGSSLASFMQVLGSKDPVILKAATARLSDSLPGEPGLTKAKAWLRNLIEHGFTLRQDREPPSEPPDGGLLTMRMETEVHALVVYCIVRAIATDDQLDLAEQSSNWSHPAVLDLYRELADCGFTRSKQCCVEYFTWMWKLTNGCPLFGDDFRSQWSYYSFLTIQELAGIIPVFQAAAEFERHVPDDIPGHLRSRIKTRLSEGGKEFIGDLIKWFGQIQQAGQDAFIMWW